MSTPMIIVIAVMVTLLVIGVAAFVGGFIWAARTKRLRSPSGTGTGTSHHDPWGMHHH